MKSGTEDNVELESVFETSPIYTKGVLPFTITTEQERFASQVQDGDWIRINVGENEIVAHVIQTTLGTKGKGEQTHFTSTLYIELVEESPQNTDRWNELDSSTTFAVNVIRCTFQTAQAWQKRDYTKLKEVGSVSDSESAKDDWRLEIHTIQSTGRTTDPQQKEAALGQSSGWALMKAAIKALKIATQSIVTDMSSKQNMDLQTRFEAYLLGLETNLSEKYQRNFYPYKEITKDQGWVLLKPADVTVQPAKRLRLTTSTGTSLAAPTDNSENVHQDFEVIAGSLDTISTLELPSEPTSSDAVFCRQDPPRISLKNLTNSDTTTIFSNSHNYEPPTRQMRLRFSSQPSSDNLLIDADADKDIMPFERDLHIHAIQDFKEELNTVITMAMSFLTGTTHQKSIREQNAAIDFKRLLPGTTSFMNLQPSAIDMLYPTTSMNLQLLTTAFSDEMSNIANASPSTDIDDTEVGACATVIWQPAIKAAMQKTPLDKNIASRFLLNDITFVPPTDKRHALIKGIVNETRATLDDIFDENKRTVLKQCREVYTTSYSPLVLEFATFGSFTPQYAQKSSEYPKPAWCLGSSPSITLEALELTLLILQRIIESEQTSSDINSLSQMEQRDDPGQSYPVKPRNTEESPDIDPRDYARKEIQYEDSLFMMNKIHMLPGEYPRRSRWSGIYGRAREALGADQMVLLWQNEHTGKPIEWNANPIRSSRISSGIGVWKGIQQPTFLDIVRSRYRSYAGPQPLPRTVQDPLLGPEFDGTVLATRWVLPGIKYADHKETIKSILSESFTGWHYSNSRSLGRTVFAWACGMYHRDITAFFETVHHDEPLGIPDTDKSPHARFVRLIYENQNKSKTENLLVQPGVVTIKGPGPNALATQCETSQWLVKTDMFRIIEGEAWHILSYMLRQSQKLPQRAVPACLASKIGYGRGIGKLTMKRLVDLRPSTHDALARLMLVTAQVYIERRIRPTEYRQIQLMNEGTLPRYKRSVFTY